MPLLPARFQPTDIPTKLGRKLPSKAEEKAKTAAANAEYEKRRALQRFESGRHDLHLVAEGIRDHLAAKKKAREAAECAEYPRPAVDSETLRNNWLAIFRSVQVGDAAVPGWKREATEALHKRALQEKFDAQMAGALSAHHVTELPDSVVNGLGSEPPEQAAASFNDEWGDWCLHGGGYCPIPDAKPGDWQYEERCGFRPHLTAAAKNYLWFYDDVPEKNQIVRYRLRKPKSEWGPWIAHKAGPCPIPDSRYGEYQIQWKYPHVATQEQTNKWCKSSHAQSLMGWHEGNITHYRLKA